MECTFLLGEYMIDMPMRQPLKLKTRLPLPRTPWPCIVHSVRCEYIIGEAMYTAGETCVLELGHTSWQ